MEPVYLTKNGHEKLKKEFEQLRSDKKKYADMVAEAREQGDLRENAGYQYARDKLSEVVSRLGELEDKLSRVRLLEETDIAENEVRIGVTVTLEDTGLKDTFTYTLVGAEESDPALGKISVHSPLGTGLLGGKINETLTIHLPAGEKKFKVLKIER